MNRELFKKIHDVISVNPESFDMTAWEEGDGTLCGTSRCIAGWAVSIAADAPIYNPVKGADQHFYSPPVVDLVERMGLDPDDASIPLIAERLLGLTERQANLAFYRFDNERMAQFVKAAADGDTDRCTELLEP